MINIGSISAATRVVNTYMLGDPLDDDT